jgi:hypothetical protein
VFEGAAGRGIDEAFDRHSSRQSRRSQLPGREGDQTPERGYNRQGRCTQPSHRGKSCPSFLAYPVPSDCESSEGTGSEELGRPSSGAPAHLSRKLWQQRKLASRSLAPALAG